MERESAQERASFDNLSMKTNLNFGDHTYSFIETDADTIKWLVFYHIFQFIDGTQINLK
jgi:hypothetical protein